MKRKEDFYNKFIGLRQGKITVNRVLRTEPRKGKMWECICDCGTVFEATTSQLSHIQSCPSCGKERTKAASKKQLTKHGKSNTRLHTLWWSMISRCTYKGDTNYGFYGASGISVCNEWRNDFMSFYNWALQNGYNDNLSIDRINPSGNYEPSNCRWVTMKTQFNNRSTTRHITVDGVTRTQQEWAKLAGLSHTAFSQARRNGKDMEAYTRKAISRGRITREVWVKE